MCKKTWELYGEEPKCDECMPTVLLPQNVKAFRVYTVCNRQLITRGMNGDAVDISIPAIEIAMKWLKIPEAEQASVGLKVLTLARHAIMAAREEQERMKGSDNA